MANITFDQTTEKAAPATTDKMPIWDVAASQAKWATIANILNARLTGGGTIVTGGFTLTVPATGTAALLGTAQTFTAAQTITADLTIGDPATASTLALHGAAGTARSIAFRSGVVNRWLLQANATAEAGSNAGSDFALLARNDAGTTLSTPFFVRRSDGFIGIGNLTPAAKLDVVGDAIVSGVATLAHTRSRSDVIAQNAVVSFTPVAVGVLVISSTTNMTVAGVVAYRAAATPLSAIIAGGANLEVTTGALTGTTGTNGKLTVSVDSGGIMYIENRLAGSLTVRTTFLC